MSLTELKAEIVALLSDDTAKVFTSLVNHITRLGRTQSKFLEARREKLLDIVMQNRQIGSLYNAFAARQAELEGRMTYSLPVFTYPEVGESLEKKAGDTEIMQNFGGVDGTDDREESQQATIDSTTAQPEGSIHIANEKTPLATPKSCEIYRTGPSIVLVQNPEDFPIHRIQEVQSQYYPSTKIAALWIHRDANGTTTKVTADVDGGSVDHLIISDMRLIVALGLHEHLQNTLLLDESKFRIDETFTIELLPGQRITDPKARIVGELLPARHAYLYWLDSRCTANPKAPPFIQEARTLARKLRRRTPDVWREVKKMWDLEQGSGGRQYRENREDHLGESPSYPTTEEKIATRCMWC
ncbi:uncharacterized protein K460DRAFT_405263 [Cucurbitaria berberidis CBS 394.84]|uniref:Uncharacterized protein n=1 Tax=Cucurbitaria berberidis CBS 394.84 TaxID=1168544 RepID=A0A9P4GF99_9PLEO|nr:uncharacterized protein K460DRAFT_405263 [Cucurbitaria berberidis CBS 394.84]KAF1844983.1 hypothetical protein K460DRAFT_405263 [Cucurbitaria berberidis CBS 394.84]